MLLENENLMNYETEKKFIMSPYNKSSFYIPGKGITVDEDGNIRFYPLDDMNDFVFGQDIEPEFLFDEYQLTNEEKEQIHQLQNINTVLSQKGLSAFYMRNEKKQIFIFLTDEDKPDAFYKILSEDIEKISKNILPDIPSNTIQNAEFIKL